jgi:hypothetical protein
MPPAAIARKRHGNARTRFLVMSRPGISGVGIDQRAYLVEERGISALTRIDCTEMRGDQLRPLRLNHRPTRHCIRTGVECGQIGDDPVRLNTRISVGGKQHTIAAAEIGSAFHCEPPRTPCAGAAIGQRYLDRIYSERKVIDDCAHNIGGSVVTIVQAEDDSIDGRRVLLRR